MLTIAEIAVGVVIIAACIAVVWLVDMHAKAKEQEAAARAADIEQAAHVAHLTPVHGRGETWA